MFLVGCGGDGVSDSKKLADLTAEESKDVCLDLAAEYPEKTIVCGTTSVTLGLATAECNTSDDVPATCTATVGDIRECTGVLYSLSTDQFCMLDSLPAACAPLEGC